MSEKKVAVVYFSGAGHTALMAEAVGKGARSVEGVKADVLPIRGSQITEGRWKDEAMLESLGAADAIVFGTPTYMGGPAAQFKAFADATAMIWFGRGWKGKLAGGFTHSGSPSGDKAGTLQYLVTLAAQHGMLWVPSDELPYLYTGKTEAINRLGFYLGVGGNTPFNPNVPASVEPGDLLTAEGYGRSVAGAVLRTGGA